MMMAAVSWQSEGHAARSKARVRARGHACVHMCVCVGAARRDDPPRCALLWQAGVLYMFTVGLELGRQRI